MDIKLQSVNVRPSKLGTTRYTLGVICRWPEGPYDTTVEGYSFDENVAQHLLRGNVWPRLFSLMRLRYSQHNP